MKKMIAKYNGLCGICDEKIRAGEEIVWSKADGAFHAGCYQDECEYSDGMKKWSDEHGQGFEPEFEPADTAQSEATEMLRQDLDSFGYDALDAEYEAEKSHYDY